MPSTPSQSFYEITENGLTINLHEGQSRALQSKKRIVAVIAGTQSGKTCFIPVWLWEEIRRKGAGDYLFVSPTFQLMEKKALPEFLTFFREMMEAGKYTSQPVRKFRFTDEGLEKIFGSGYLAECRRKRILRSAAGVNIFFGYGEDPESLESSTVKACAIDEAGQDKFKVTSWEAIQRRLAINEGRVLIATTPYSMGWMKSLIWDPWKKADENHPEIDVINFDSTQNPIFKKAEFERAKEKMPPWRFDMFYRGIFTKPAGLIYDSFVDAPEPLGHRCSPFKIPEHWERFVGIDFGVVNTACVFFARDPNTQQLYLYKEYHTGSKSVEDHIAFIKSGFRDTPTTVGGARSEDEWRSKFTSKGLPINKPSQWDVEVGIASVYGCFAQGKIRVFDSCKRWLHQVNSYSRKLDANQEPTTEISNSQVYHLLDATRYIISYIFPSSTFTAPKAGGDRLQENASLDSLKIKRGDQAQSIKPSVVFSASNSPRVLTGSRGVSAGIASPFDVSRFHNPYSIRIR